MRRVNEAGPLSKDDLRLLAVRAGYFQDAESATRSVHATLLGIVKGGRVRELPNGALAPASMIDTLGRDGRSDDQLLLTCYWRAELPRSSSATSLRTLASA